MNITPRLRQMLLMLSSDKPGEVIAAASAIGRLLHAQGKDWHDLVNGLLPVKTERVVVKEEEDWHVMRDFCIERMGFLRSREQEFMQTLKYWRGDLTEKQAGWLCAIYARLGGGYGDA